MSGKYETSIYTKKQLENARMRGQMKGWVQGAGSTFLLILLLKVLGWIPALLLLIVIGFIGVKIFKAGKQTSD